MDFLPVYYHKNYLCYKLNIKPYYISRELPTFSYGLFQFLSLTIFSDFLFYGLHRLFHIPYLYKNIHKFHHSYNYTFAAVHHYIHDIETLVFILPALIPPILLNSHIVITWLYILFIQFVGIYGHSGYVFFDCITKYLPFMRSDYHDAHHYLFNKNFGLTWTTVDKIFGTLQIPEKY